MIAEKEMAKTTPRAAMIAPETAPRRREAAVIGDARDGKGLRRFVGYGMRLESGWNPYGT